MGMMNFRAEDELREALRDRAGADGVPVSTVIRRAVEAYLGVEPRESEAPRVLRREWTGQGKPRAVEDTEPAPTHRHRMNKTGALRFEHGAKVEHYQCDCGEERWGR